MPEQAKKTPQKPARKFHRFLTDKGTVYIRGPVDILIRYGPGLLVQGDESFKLRDEPDTEETAYNRALRLFGKGLKKMIDEPEIHANPAQIRTVRLKAGYPFLHVAGMDYKVQGASLDDVLAALDPSYASDD